MSPASFRAAVAAAAVAFATREGLIPKTARRAARRAGGRFMRWMDARRERMDTSTLG